MNKYIITFKEWDEYGYHAIRAIQMEGYSPEDASDKFWRLYTDGDVKIILISQLNF